MADDNNADELESADTVAVKSRKTLKGILPRILKIVLIVLAAAIFIVTIVAITVMVVNRSNAPTTAIPVNEEYTVSRPSYDWYTSLDTIRTSTSDPVPAAVSVTIALGYQRDDRQAATEITERRIEIIDFLRRFFSEQTVEDLRPQNEDVLRQQIRDQINDDILSTSRIRDVRFTSKDVVQQ